MSYTSLMEVVHYLRSLPKKKFSESMAAIKNLSTLAMASLDHDTAQLALEMLPRYTSKGLGGRDCIILATMKIHGVGTDNSSGYDTRFSSVSFC